MSIHRVDRSDGSKYVVYDESGNIVIISKNKLVCVAEMNRRLLTQRAMWWSKAIRYLPCLNKIALHP